MKFNIIYSRLVILSAFIIFSCSSDSTNEGSVIDEPVKTINLPTLSTNEPENVDTFKATIWGKVLSNGGGSIKERGICFGLNQAPTYDGAKEEAIIVKGSGEFQVNLSELQSGQKYYARAYAVNEKGVGYGNEVNFTTSSINQPILKIGDTKVAGAHDIWLDVKVEEKGDLEINEIGVVYGTSSKPTVEGNKVPRDQFENFFKQRITDLEQQTIYYIRAYAVTDDSITYSDEIAIGTIKEGNFTWSFWWEDSADPAFDRLREAFNKATWYYNNFTSIEKHVNVNYNTGTPTADANIDGWINFGANEGYQRTGTAMHEMAHTVGVGTHWKYPELMQGTWQGNRATEILRFMTNDPNAQIFGDSIHFWPYGINGAHEDNGTEMLYIIHALILQGMKADGLPNNW